MHTHPEQWAANAALPGSSWGFGALLKGLTSVMVLKVERMFVIQSPHRQFLLDPRFEPTTSGYKSDVSHQNGFFIYVYIYIYIKPYILITADKGCVCITKGPTIVIIIIWCYFKSFFLRT